MKPIAVALLFALAASAQAQTAAKPAKPATAAGSAKTTAAATAAHTSAASASSYKVPADEKRVPGIPKTAFAVRYQDIKIGAGPEAEAGKLWHIKYKGWRAKDGVVFDAWDKHAQPELGADGKPVMGPDGKPKMGDPQPLMFPQGTGRMIPGFDYGLTGMHVGGKRRLFIPWQMAYGNRDLPDRGPDHPGIPARSDLIFDVELVEVTDMPQPPQRPMMPSTQPAPGNPHNPSAPSTPPPAGATAAPAAPGTAPNVHATTPAPDTQAAPKPAPQPSAPQQQSTDQNKPQ